MRTHAPRRLYTTEEGSRSGLSYTRQTPGEVQCQYGVSLSRYMSLLILRWLGTTSSTLSTPSSPRVDVRCKLAGGRCSSEHASMRLSFIAPHKSFSFTPPSPASPTHDGDGAGVLQHLHARGAGSLMTPNMSIRRERHGAGDAAASGVVERVTELAALRPTRMSEVGAVVGACTQPCRECAQRVEV
jgi:hypothetical protein